MRASIPGTKRGPGLPSGVVAEPLAQVLQDVGCGAKFRRACADDGLCSGTQRGPGLPSGVAAEPLAQVLHKALNVGQTSGVRAPMMASVPGTQRGPGLPSSVAADPLVRGAQDGGCGAGFWSAGGDDGLCCGDKTRSGAAEQCGGGIAGARLYGTLGVGRASGVRAVMTASIAGTKRGLGQPRGVVAESLARCCTRR